MRFVQYGDRLHVLLRDKEISVAFSNKIAYDNFLLYNSSHSKFKTMSQCHIVIRKG